MTELSDDAQQSPPHSIRRAQRVLIVGGSTRAAAASARRAGFVPVCADLFADVDTRQLAEVIPVRAYPDSLPDDIAQVEAAGWFYTGSLENRADLIDRIEQAVAPEGPQYGPLWGTSSLALSQLRNPLWIADTLQQAGGTALEVRSQQSPPAADATWMLKPLSSAGGRAVCIWNDARLRRGMDEPVYFQRRCEGDVLSAVFWCAVNSIELLGMTRQLPGHAWSGATEPFLYSGSIGPLPLDGADLDSCERLGRAVTWQIQALASATALRGIVGIDFIRDAAGVPWILEVNPRYTASVEILELALRQPLLRNLGQSDADASRDGRATSQHSATSRHTVVAKLILYAPRALIAPDLKQPQSFHPRQSADLWSVPFVADIPVPGSRIDVGWPICTVFAAGSTEDECFSRLQRRVDIVWKMVNHPPDDCVGWLQQ